jgi:ABC-type taurine transport system ATPase subunit
MKTLKDIDLLDTANNRVKHLSGGQKRKLSVGIAIIGDPKVSHGQPFLFSIKIFYENFFFRL